MGKGIALQFKHAFPDNFKAYLQACAAGQVEPGRMFIYDTGGLQKPRYIINFPTKRHWRGKSRISDIVSGLRSLVEDVRRLDIRSVALPPLGCGNGGLDWREVYPLIEQAFVDLPQIRVLVFEPTGAPAAEAMKNRTSRPKMTIGRAAVLGLMNRYAVPGYDYRMSLLEVQKLVYFLTVAGERLNQVEFVKGPYGPYADTLRHVFERMEGHFITGYGDGRNSPEIPIELKGDAAIEADHFLSSHPETKARFERVTQPIKGFETPYGMELLSSVHWVATRENAEAGVDVEAAIADVHAWNDRKRKLLRDEHIRVAWTRLHDQGWI